ncbi:MAG: hypothetical protein Q9223_004411 [Gallowayella weberi]
MKSKSGCPQVPKKSAVIDKANKEQKAAPPPSFLKHATPAPSAPGLPEHAPLQILERDLQKIVLTGGAVEPLLRVK